MIPLHTHLCMILGVALVYPLKEKQETGGKVKSSKEVYNEEFQKVLIYVINSILVAQQNVLF